MKFKRIHNVTFLNIREQRKEPLIATLVYCTDFNIVRIKNQAVGRGFLMKGGNQASRGALAPGKRRLAVA